MVAVFNSSIARSTHVTLAAVIAVTLVACASSGSLGLARDAEITQNYDIAVAEYNKVLIKDPGNRDAQQGLERAKLRASQDHFTKARRLNAASKLEQSLVEYQLANELNPAN